LQEPDANPSQEAESGRGDEAAGKGRKETGKGRLDWSRERERERPVFPVNSPGPPACFLWANGSEAASRGIAGTVGIKPVYSVSILIVDILFLGNI
jgi:hypothetical protein